MEDIRPYRDEDEEHEDESENPVEWDLARLAKDEELPFHLPRD